MFSPTMESHLSERRGATTVPLILSEFPAPPSHIPTTPSSGTFPIPPNPPLSLPPSTPLPPVPGRSPISEYDTLRFISAARSRRASKLSVTSSRRDSTATLASITSGTSTSPRSPVISLSYGEMIDSGSRSIRSLSSAGSVSSMSRRYTFEKSPTLEPQIREEDPTSLTEMTIDEFGVIVHMPLESEVSGEESVPELSLASSLSRRRSASRNHRIGLNDSISSIDMRDLPALQEDELESIVAPPVLPVRPRPGADLRIKHPRPPTAIINKDLPPLPHPPPDNRASAYWPESDSSSTPTSAPVSGRLVEDVRSDSPDISSILAVTPRPRRRSSSLYSGGSRPTSMSNRSSRASSLRKSSGIAGNKFSEGLAVPVPKLNMSRNSRPSELVYNRRGKTHSDDESDYGEIPMDGTGTAMDIAMLDKEAEAILERQLEGVGTDSEGEGSDSSIDVHTPLPHLMLRDGMLSPHSKILPQTSRKTTPHDKHLSVESSTSVLTKSGMFKDQRDTHRRRVRHRDGALLKGGIGLTTGLGWSDSEDEDAPSPLTRRISSMVLSRRTSQTSLNSSLSRKQSSSSQSTPHPLSRSVSETLSCASKTLAQARQRHPSLPPPTSWQGATCISRSARTSAGSLYSDTGSQYAMGGRMSLGEIREREKDDSGIMTPSSASSTSLPMPLTPVGDDDAWLSAPMRNNSSSLNSKTPSKSFKESTKDFPRERTQSSSSSTGRISAMPLTASPEFTPNIRTPIPRPLKLGSSISSKPSLSNLRAPSVTRSTLPTASTPAQIPTPRKTGLSHKVGPPITPTSTSRLARPPVVSEPKTISPIRSTTPGDPIRPKPRTGTGMVYRTGSASRTTMMRQPSTTLLRSQSSKGM